MGIVTYQASIAVNTPSTRRGIPAGGIRNLLEMGAGDERLSEILRIVHDGHDDEPRVSIGFIEPCEILRQRSIRAVGHSIFPKISREHSRCDHLQRRAASST